MATGSPTGRIPSRSEFDEDDEVLDQAVEAVRLDADVLGQRAPAVRLELALGQQLGAAVDRRHRRSQLVRQDVEERLAVGLVDEPALRRGPRRDRTPGGRVCWQERLGLEPSDRAASCPNGRLWLGHTGSSPTGVTLRVRRANVTDVQPRADR